MRDNKKIWFGFFVFFAFIFGFTGCSESQSYAELLRDEEEAVNWYLAKCNVLLDLPEDPKDLVTVNAFGEEAPFYKLDNDGYVYMQVVNADFDEMVSEGDLVYFRFMRQNIATLYEYDGELESWEGNSDYLPNGTASFVYKNNVLTSSTKWGTGIQMPLQYLGFNSEVNLILKSYYGFTDEQTYCIPYIMNIRYFRPEY